MIAELKVVEGVVSARKKRSATASLIGGKSFSLKLDHTRHGGGEAAVGCEMKPKNLV